jgi:hypothetical protein
MQLASGLHRAPLRCARAFGRAEKAFSSATQRFPLSARDARLGDALGYLLDAPTALNVVIATSFVALNLWHSRTILALIALFFD